MSNEKLTLEEASRELVRVLDVVLPKVNGVVLLQSLRQGSAAYDGPDPSLAVERVREILGLPNPAAVERDFWPEGYCRTCDGTGEVVAGTGEMPFREGHFLDLYLTSVPDDERAVEILRQPVGGVGAGRPPPPTSARRIVESLKAAPFLLRRGAEVNPRFQAWTRDFKALGARFLWRRSVVHSMYDVCPDCEGTANRGLEKQMPYDLDPAAPVEIRGDDLSEPQRQYDRRHKRGEFAEKTT